MVRGRSTDYEWAKILYEKCMLDRDDADYYAGKFVRHDLSVSDIPELNQQVLREVGVQRMGHVMAILKHAKEMKSVKPRGGRNTRRARSVSSRSSSSGRSSSRSPSPPPRKSRSTKRKSSPIPDRKSTNKKSPAATTARKRQPSPSSSSEAASSSDSSRSPSPPPKKKKETVVPNKIPHIDRTTAKKPTAIVQKLDDDDLLAASIELPARFKSKQKQPTILKSAMSSGGPMVSREFKGSEELERKYGKEGVKSDRRGSGGITYVRPESLKQTVTKQTVVRTGVLKNTSRNEPKLRSAAMDDLDDDRRGETTSSVFKRLSVGSRSSRNENSKVEDVRSNKRERDSRDKSRENNKKTINGDKGDIGGLARRLSKASATSRRTSDGHLEEIDHKETRTGKSEGLFANENDDFDKVLNAKRSEKKSERSDLDHDWKKEPRRNSMQDRLGSSNERSDRDRSDKNRSDKDRRASNGSGIQARLGRTKKERSRSPVKSDIRNRLGNKRD